MATSKRTQKIVFHGEFIKKNAEKVEEKEIERLTRLAFVMINNAAEKMLREGTCRCVLCNSKDEINWELTTGLGFFRVVEELERAGMAIEYIERADGTTDIVLIVP